MDWLSEKAPKFCVLRKFQEVTSEESPQMPGSNTTNIDTTTSTDPSSSCPNQVTYRRPEGTFLFY